MSRIKVLSVVARRRSDGACSGSSAKRMSVATLSHPNILGDLRFRRTRDATAVRRHRSCSTGRRCGRDSSEGAAACRAKRRRATQSQIATALGRDARQRGIVHRDLKPENILFTKPGTGRAK